MGARRKLVAGNWKMNGSQGLAGQMSDALQDFAMRDRGVDLALFPPLTLLRVLDADHSRSFTLGAQDISAHASGAYTGEVSARLLVEAGADAVLVGHSERRNLHGESDALIEQKLLRALENGLQPYLCIGETRTEREAGRTFAVVERQLGLLRNAQIRSELRSMTIAYEPVWAIGTGLTASPEQAQEVHAHIRSILSGWDANIAGLMRLLYGGSVTPDTAAGLFQCPDIDGGLVGGASLKVDSLLAIAEAATKD